MNPWVVSRHAFWILSSVLALACEPARPQTTDSQTNWMRSCSIDSQCGAKLSCVCGVCTSTCASDAECASLPGTVCIGASEAGSIAQCGGIAPTSAGLCMPRCEEDSCASGQMCVAGVCTPVPDSKAAIVVETGIRHQTLTGYGASVAFVESEILEHPSGPMLYQALFADLGLDVLRFRNRYAETGADLSTAAELVSVAADSLGRAPTVIMTSWSPPAALKASGALYCSGNPGTCTLTRLPGGGFDYDAFAAYWRASLDAYQALGVVPDYVGLQNNPDWIPTSAEQGQACRFLPVEGTTPVTVNGITSTVSYPGFAEAQAATLAAFSGLASVPKMLAPEAANVYGVEDYANALDLSPVDALSHHLYGASLDNLQAPEMAALGELARLHDRPLFQTEMHADGIGTAVLTHYATAVEGASAYLQTTLVGSASGPAASPYALVGLDPGRFVLQDPYFALRHYALHTDPGWVRVDATSSDVRLLVSAWLSPNEDALTVVLVNSGPDQVAFHLEISGATMTESEVRRTVFDGAERFQNLGSLSAEGVLEIPGRSVVTVALRQ
jgi:hypothetical protein